MSYSTEKIIPAELVLRAKETLSMPGAAREERRLAHNIVLEAELRAGARPFLPYCPTEGKIVDREPVPEPRRGIFRVFG